MKACSGTEHEDVEMGIVRSLVKGERKDDVKSVSLASLQLANPPILICFLAERGPKAKTQI